MIKGIGVDLVLVDEVQDQSVYEDMILSEKEKVVYDNIPSLEGKLMFLAGRYAAKEAIFKAAKKYNKSLKYHDITVLGKGDGTVSVESELITDDEIVHVSMTHTEEYAIAYAVIESK